MPQRSADLRRLASFVVRHRRLTILVVGALSAVLALQVSNLRIEVNADEQLPQAHPYVAAFRKVQYLFGDKDLLVISISPIRGGIADRPFLSAISDITNQIRDMPGCVRPLLQGVGSSATKSIEVTADGLRVAPLLGNLPTTPEQSSLFRERLLADPLFYRTLISDDGNALAIYVTFEPTAELPGYVNIVERVESILRSVNHNQLFTYSLSGPVAIVAGLTTYAGRALLLFPVSLVIIGLIHFEAFRTWQAVFLPLLTGLLGVIWAVGLMGTFRIPLDPFNSTTPVLILAVGAGHAVQILKRYYELIQEADSPEEAIIRALETTGIATIASSLIAAVSFLSLITFRTTSMQRFGTFTALGILSSLAIELTLIPALRASLPASSGSASKPFGAVLSHRLTTWLTTKHGTDSTLIAYVLLVAASAALSFNLSTDSSFVRQFSASHPVRAQDSYINNHFSGANVLLFLVTAPPDSTLATPSSMNAIRSFEDRLSELPTVGHVTSITDTLGRMHSVLSPGSKEALPQSAELLNQYLFLYSLSGGDELSTLLTPDYRSTKIVALVTEDSTAQGKELIRRARSIAKEVLPQNLEFDVAGTIASNIALTEVMIRGKLLNICQVIAITVTISGLVLGSVVGGLLVALPLALAVLVNFGAMSLLAIPLDVGTAAVSAMAVGIGADYAIYFLFRLREEIVRLGDYHAALERTIQTAGGAIISVATAVGCGYAILCVAGYQLYVNLGLLIALAMATSSIASIVVIPATIGALLEREFRLSFLQNPKLTPEVPPKLRQTTRG